MGMPDVALVGHRSRRSRPGPSSRRSATIPSATPARPPRASRPRARLAPLRVPSARVSCSVANAPSAARAPHLEFEAGQVGGLPAIVRVELTRPRPRARRSEPRSSSGCRDGGATLARPAKPSGSFHDSRTDAGPVRTWARPAPARRANRSYVSSPNRPAVAVDPGRVVVDEDRRPLASPSRVRCGRPSPRA